MRFDGFINVSVCSGRKSLVYSNEEILWSDFVKRLGSTVYTVESMCEYDGMNKSMQDDVKDVGGFVGGSLKDGRRRKSNVISRSVLTLDADYAYVGMDGVVDLLYGFGCCVYSTHKHRSDKPRLRFVIPLSRRVSDDEYEAVARMVASDLGMDYFDDSTYEAERLMYYPSTSSDGEFVYRVCDGEWVDVDEVLSRYVDYRDVSSWPVSSRCREKLKKVSDVQENPRQKEGMIGAFCRVYDVHGAIDKFLGGVYERLDDSRYSYVNGSAAGGLVIYGDGDFAYSHHSTDPCGGRLCNAFDLVRVHRFCKNGVDDEKSFKDMIEFCGSDESVVGEFGRFKIRQAKSDFSDIDIVEDVDIDDSWLESLEMDKKGGYKSSIKNLCTILNNDVHLKDTICFDEFLDCIMKSRDVAWNDYDDALLRHYIEKTYDIYTPVKTDDAITSVAKSRSYHPIRDYINNLRWDGVNRVDSLLIDYLGAEDSAYCRAVMRKSLAAAVARVFEPGVKFDYMPVLVGPQGVGKSHILSLLGGSWYSDSFNTVMGKEAYEQLSGCWIIEMAELSAIRKVEAEAVKHFISKRDDVYRAAYGRRVVKHPRQCVFFGTTNDVEFLRDKTGNRRYWPVVVAKNKPRKNMWESLDKHEIDMIWAEAKVIYDNKESLVLDKGLDVEAMKKQEEHMEANTKEGMIIEYLDMLLPVEWSDMDMGARRRFVSGGDFVDVKGVKRRERVCAMEIWCELFGGDAKYMNAQQSREINDILRNIEGWGAYPKGSGKLRFSVYGIQKAFVRLCNDEC